MDIVSAESRSLHQQQLVQDMFRAKQRLYKRLIGMVEVQLERDLEMQLIKDDDDDSHVDDVDSHEADDDILQPLGLQF